MMRNILVSEQQSPRFDVAQIFFPKACPREHCGGDVGRFAEYEGQTFKCLTCAREVKEVSLNGNG